MTKFDMNHEKIKDSSNTVSKCNMHNVKHSNDNATMRDSRVWDNGLIGDPNPYGPDKIYPHFIVKITFFMVKSVFKLK